MKKHPLQGQPSLGNQAEEWKWRRDNSFQKLSSFHSSNNIVSERDVLRFRDIFCTKKLHFFCISFFHKKFMVHRVWRKRPLPWLEASAHYKSTRISIQWELIWPTRLTLFRQFLHRKESAPPPNGLPSGMQGEKSSKVGGPSQLPKKEFGIAGKGMRMSANFFPFGIGEEPVQSMHMCMSQVNE